MERKCSNCKEVKSLEEFFKDSSKALGRSYWCKVCNATYSKAHYNYIKVRPVRTIIPKPCAQCGESMTKSSLESYNSWLERILCSRTCKFVYRKGKGTKPRVRRNCTPEEKARRNELIDFSGEKNPFYGRKHTKETIEVLRKANTGRFPKSFYSANGVKGARACANLYPTSIEKAVYDELEKRGVEFEPQKVINGKFVVDAYVPALNLVIEVDGDYWHSLDKVVKRDKSKNAYLSACGFNLLRLPEHEIRDKSYKAKLDERLDL